MEWFHAGDFLGEREKGFEEDWDGEFGRDESGGGRPPFPRRKRVGRNRHGRGWEQNRVSTTNFDKSKEKLFSFSFLIIFFFLLFLLVIQTMKGKKYLGVLSDVFFGVSLIIVGF